MITNPKTVLLFPKQCYSTSSKHTHSDTSYYNDLMRKLVIFKVLMGRSGINLLIKRNG
jgi:hypothetical protein